MQIHINLTQREVNRAKQGGVFVALMAVMIGFSVYDPETYKFVGTCFGSWYVGTAVGRWSRERWPT